MRRAALIGVAVVVGLGVMIMGSLFALGWPDRQYATSFETIPLGATRQAVLEKLGAPAAITKDCYVAQFVRFENP
ncbi:MAG TPA: hypothetical protein VF110_00965, partial [Burkholderiales bacterium]